MTELRSARRIVVVGTSGSGKTTLAAQIAVRLGVPHVELDEIMHGPGWTAASVEVFQATLVARLDAAPDGWVVDGNYTDRAHPITWPCADLVVWLDLPRHQVMRQLLRRTFVRIVFRTPLWNGNREDLRAVFGRESIVAWSWNTHARNRARYGALLAADAPDNPPIVRLRSHAEAAELAERLGRPVR